MQQAFVSEVLLHEVSEETRLQVLISTQHLLGLLTKTERQEKFNLWLTE